MRKAIVVIGIVGIFAAVLTIAAVQAQGPSPSSSLPPLPGPVLGSYDTINFQGQLYDQTGTNPVPAGNYNMEFSICSDAGCGGVVWGPHEFTVAVDDLGLFSVLLTGLNADHFTGDRWLRVRVCTTVNQSPCTSGWDDMGPYQPMTGVALAIGNIRKNLPDTSAAYSDGYILTVNNTNPGAGGGVYGTGRRYGLYGSAGDNGDGVRGEATGPAGWGVSGYSADGYGVYGKSDNNIGVYGYASAASGTTYGVYAKHESTEGAAGYFWADNGSGTKAGVYGRDDSNDGFGVVGHHWLYGVGVGAWSYGGHLIEAYDGDYPGGDLRFYIDQAGNVYADGNYFTFGMHFPAPEGSDSHPLSAIVSPGVWSEDLGTGILVEGQTIVEIDPLFAQMVNLEEEYHVFLTPLSQEPVLLFVTAKTPTDFTVRGVTLDGQPAACSFDYRLVAKRLGYENLRMEPAPVAPSPPKKPEPPDSGKPATKP